MRSVVSLVLVGLAATGFGRLVLRRRRGRSAPATGETRPDEAQRGVGRRADWRHLIDAGDGRPRPLTVLLGLGPADEWTWLIDDGWTERVVTELPTPGRERADVVVIGTGADQEPSLLDRARSALADDGALVVLVPAGRTLDRRSPSAVVAGTLASSGNGPVGPVRRHLLLPDAERPRRFLPLDHAGGLAWLAGPRPRLVEAELPLRRRLVRRAATRVARSRPELLGGVAVVAGPRPDHEPAVILTSGFDEGSRTVVLPLGDDGRPTSVVKLASRPAYRANAEREHQLLARLAPVVRPPGLVPTPLDRWERHGVLAVVESYAGRWSVTDLLEEQGSLERRVALLAPALETIGLLARTGARSETWTSDGFDELIGRWFDQLDEAEGSSPDRTALRRDLANRSAELEGATIPMGLRHFDLGPWNMVAADRGRLEGPVAADRGRLEGPVAADRGRLEGPVAADRGRPEGDRFDQGGPALAGLTVVDWELAPPRTEPFGPIGADHLYFTKYWLHIAAGCRTVEEELDAFPFLTSAGDRQLDEARSAAETALVRATSALGVPTGFLPLLEAHVWAEAAAYTRHRRRHRQGDGGSPARYLRAVARHRAALLTRRPVASGPPPGEGRGLS